MIFSCIIAVGDDNMEKRPIDDKEDVEYICPSASWGDMTGLIPVSAADSAERDSYDEIYPYLPQYGGKKE